MATNRTNGVVAALVGIAAASFAGSSLAALDGDDAKVPSAKALDYDGGMVCYVRVADLERSITWYSDVLGLEVISQVDEIGWCELQSPAKGLAIGLLRDPKPDPSGGATIVFGVKDLDRARARLEKLGVKFTGPTSVHEGYVKLAGFTDPDGNLLTLSQSLAEPGSAPR